jgi:hypothetical protein
MSRGCLRAVDQLKEMEPWNPTLATLGRAGNEQLFGGKEGAPGSFTGLKWRRSG